MKQPSINGFGHTWCFNALQCVTALEFRDITPVHASDCVVQGNPAVIISWPTIFTFTDAICLQLILK